MNILTELNALLAPVLPVETGIFSGKAPDEYIVITPMADVFELHADNRPQAETQEARLSLYSKGNYLARKNQVVKALLDADFTITARIYVGYETDSQYHHAAIDVAKNYDLEE
jgi:hypothetical protein